MVHYSYDSIATALEYKINKHPQKDLKDRGYEWVACCPYPIYDCWVFRFEKELENPPGYMRRLSDDFKFPWEVGGNEDAADGQD